MTAGRATNAKQLWTALAIITRLWPVFYFTTFHFWYSLSEHHARYSHLPGTRSLCVSLCVCVPSCVSVSLYFCLSCFYFECQPKTHSSGPQAYYNPALLATLEALCHDLTDEGSRSIFQMDIPKCLVRCSWNADVPCVSLAATHLVACSVESLISLVVLSPIWYSCFLRCLPQ